MLPSQYGGGKEPQVTSRNVGRITSDLIIRIEIDTNTNYYFVTTISQMQNNWKMVLDLGLEIDVQKDGIKESSTCSFTTDQATSKAGRILNENRCISLLFLLLPDSANAKALKFCNQVSAIRGILFYSLYYVSNI